MSGVPEAGFDAGRGAAQVLESVMVAEVYRGQALYKAPNENQGE